jgi:hypothetical protein
LLPVFWLPTKTILSSSKLDVNENLAFLASSMVICGMDVSEMARMGGLARQKAMTAEQRRKLVTKASKAAAAARTKKAKEKKRAKQQ